MQSRHKQNSDRGLTPRKPRREIDFERTLEGRKAKARDRVIKAAKLLDKITIMDDEFNDGTNRIWNTYTERGAEKLFKAVRALRKLERAHK